MIFTASGFERADATFMARVVGSDGLVLASSGVSTATFSLNDLDSETPETPTASGPLTVSSVFLGHLTVDSKWAADGVGYNFILSLPGRYFLVPDHVYRLEIHATATTGEVLTWAWDYTTLRTFGPFPAQGNVSRSLAIPWESR